MKHTQNQALKQQVATEYGKLANATAKAGIAKLFGCCNPLQSARKVSQAMGYTPEQLDVIPDQANLGVGCGTPLDQAALHPGEIVVDLGSGAGMDAFLAASYVGQSGKVIGVDLSKDMVRLAQKNAQKAEIAQVEFIQGDIEQIPLPDSHADAVVSNCVINLTPNKAAVFQEAFRVLKPGGRLAISDVILEGELPEEIKGSLTGHLACVSGADRLENYLKYAAEAGFEHVQVPRKARFALDVLAADPTVQQLAKQLDMELDSAMAQQLSEQVASITLTAIKP